VGVGGVFRVDFQVWVDFLYVRIPMVHADENLRAMLTKTNGQFVMIFATMFP